MRSLLTVSPDLPDAAALLERVRAVLRAHGEIVAELPADNTPVPDSLDFDRVLAVGGDGTLIAQVRRILHHGVPLIGLNSGRLGFLAEFDVASLEAHAEQIFGPTPLVCHRMVLDVQVLRADGSLVHSGIAVNDAVVSAGIPFRMIELRVDFGQDTGQDTGPDIAGDGVIVASPIGSTAYNVSAGGPIVHPDVEALIVTPICAHSLAFRPIVLPSHIEVIVHVERANEGTNLAIDGQIHVRLHRGDTIRVARHEMMARLIGNPAVTYGRQLISKMRWAAPPNYRDRGA